MAQEPSVAFLCTAFLAGCIGAPPGEAIDDVRSSADVSVTDDVVSDSGQVPDLPLAADVSDDVPGDLSDGDAADSGLDGGVDDADRSPDAVDMSDSRAPGAVLLYRFDAGSGTTVFDVSGVGQPADLAFAASGDVVWVADGLKLTGDGAALSAGTVPKLHSECSDADAVTIEAWVTPAREIADGPDRVFAYSQDSGDVNLMFGQGRANPADHFTLRVRAEGSAQFGRPEVHPDHVVSTTLTHVVGSYDGATSTWAAYVNGSAVEPRVESFQDFAGGGSLRWNSAYEVVVGDENGTSDAGRRWLGTLHLIAVYCRVLTPAEAEQNFLAGPRPE